MVKFYLGANFRCPHCGHTLKNEQTEDGKFITRHLDYGCYYDGDVFETPTIQLERVMNAIPEKV
jgi:hypothetical protein